MGHYFGFCYALWATMYVEWSPTFKKKTALCGPQCRMGLRAMGYSAGLSPMLQSVAICSKTALTGSSSSKLLVAPLGCQPLPPVAGSKRLVHWTSETWCKCEKCWYSTGPPHPRNGYGPFGILAVCYINLWPVVRMELGQEGWLKQLVAKVRGPIVASDQGSRQGHHCSETALTGKPSSKVWVEPRGANRCSLWQEANG
jgi:hypothetical protein